MPPLELDEQLKQLALTAQQQPMNTNGRRLALTKLVNKILQSGRLYRPHQEQFSVISEYTYNEALQKLWLYICQHIDKYESEQAEMMEWVNSLLEMCFFKEAILEILDEPNLQRMSLSDLDDFAQGFTKDRNYI